LRLQVALADRPLVPHRVDPAPVLSAGALAIVTSRVSLVTSAFASDRATQLIPRERDIATAIVSAQGRAVVVADVDQWQANWGSLTAARSVATVAMHACSSADFRALTRSRELPPPLPPGDSEACWVLTDDGTARRARLPLRPTTSDSAYKPAI
jgi:S-DNA-T family DNA segregation ATPase FtsK/SpoIIIE